MTDPIQVVVSTESAGGACLGEAVVMKVSGASDRSPVAELEHALAEVYADGATNIAVDLSGLDAIDSEAVGVIAAYRRRVRARGGDIVVVSASRADEQALRVEQRLEDAVAALLSGRS
jgi:anti-anti-sigma factor